jgi:hypothetical protein
MHTPEEVDRAFSPIADVVEQFVQTQSFYLDKCPRGNSGWELTRPHDRGGTITLLLLYDATLGLGIGAVWQFPCPEMALLYSHFRPIRPCVLEPEIVVATLNSELQRLVNVPFGYWTHIQPLDATS